MKPVCAILLVSTFAACSFAQHSVSGQHPSGARPQSAPATGGTHVVYPSAGITFPATGSNSFTPASPFSVTNPAFASSLGATVSGQSAGRGHRHYRQGVLVPYAYPVYVGGYGDYSYGNGYAPDEQQPNVTIINPPAQTPQVVINQNFIPEHATPVMHDYTEDSSGGIRVYEAPGREPVDMSAGENTSYYLVAFKDHSIYSAFAYWVDGDTLHYVTPQRVHNQASLALVDRELTDKLNRNRNMQVKLPK